MNYFVNNTINYPNGWGMIKIITIDNSGNWTIKNNILVSSDPVYYFSGSVSHETIDYNNYYSLTSTPFNNDGWTNWKNAGNDAQGFVQNPKLRASDSALTTLSPTAVKSGGITIGSITGITGITAWPMTGVLAIDGNALDGTHPAMGAYAQAVASPTVSTEAVTSIHATTATGNGTISGDTGWTISEDGVAIGASANPTIAGTPNSDGPIIEIQCNLCGFSYPSSELTEGLCRWCVDKSC